MRRGTSLHFIPKECTTGLRRTSKLQKNRARLENLCPSKCGDNFPQMQKSADFKATALHIDTGTVRSETPPSYQFLEPQTPKRNQKHAPVNDALHRNPNLMAVDVGKQVDLAGSSPELLGQRGSSWWTGKAPASTPGYNPDSGTVSALPSPALDTLTLSQIQDYFDNTWTLTEILFSSIQGARDARAQVVPG